MGFIYDLPLPDDARLSGVCRIIKWRVGEWAKIDRSTPLVTVESGQAHYRVLANGPGYIHTLVAVEGAEVRPKECIAKIASEGEDIPYGRPYSLLEDVEPS